MKLLTSVRRVALPLVAVVATAGLVAGCDGNTKGTATPQTSATGSVQTSIPESAVWDPRKDLPDSAIEAAGGLDVKSKDNDVAGVKFEGWNVSGWEGTWFNLDIYATGMSQQDALKVGDDMANPRPITIGPRQATQMDGTDTSIPSSWIIFQTSGGTIEFNVQGAVGHRHGGDPAMEVKRLAEALEKYLPSGK